MKPFKQIKVFVVTAREDHPKSWIIWLLIFYPARFLLKLFFGVLKKILGFVIAVLWKIVSDPTYSGLVWALLYTLFYKVIIDSNIEGRLFLNGFQNDSIIMRNYIDWIGIVYGFLVSMIFVRVWERVDTVSRSVSKEARALTILIDRVHSMSLSSSDILVSSRDGILLRINDYINHVEETYASEHENENQRLAGDKKLEEIERVIKARIETKKKYASLDLSQSVRDVMSARDERIYVAKLHMPAAVWLLLLVSSLLWSFLFMFINFDNRWMGYILFFGVAFIVATIITTILAFNTPVRIEWNDPSSSWKTLKSKFHPATNGKIS